MIRKGLGCRVPPRPVFCLNLHSFALFYLKKLALASLTPSYLGAFRQGLSAQCA